MVDKSQNVVEGVSRALQLHFYIFVLVRTPRNLDRLYQVVLDVLVTNRRRVGGVDVVTRRGAGDQGKA